MPSDKMIFVAEISDTLLKFLGFENKKIKIFRSKGLLAHLLKRKHYKAAKYLDYIPEIISSPDYAGCCEGQIELVKTFKDNIFLSIKLDAAKDLYYVATLFDVSMAKIEAYCKSGRLKKWNAKIDEKSFSAIIKAKFDEQERHPALPKGNLI